MTSTFSPHNLLVPPIKDEIGGDPQSRAVRGRDRRAEDGDQPPRMPSRRAS
jgi:hypothetical protein